MEAPEPFVAALEPGLGEKLAIVPIAPAPHLGELVGLEELPAVLRDLVAPRQQPAIVAAHAAPQRVVLGAGEAEDLVNEAEVVLDQEVEADLGVLEQPALGE